MNLDFQVVAVDRAQVADFFAMDSEQLSLANGRRQIALSSSGYPCRVSLEDAREGEQLLLIPLDYHPATSPYRASGPVYVRETATTAQLAPNTIPKFLLHRNLSLRAYDIEGMMCDAKLTPGELLESAIAGQLADPRVSYLHIHNSGPGCFLCKVERANTAS